uniref:Uncharacterized protein n=1 Tax=Nelumbo nucifera TaxID=4432 RepID=A0A822XS69_NELNU|nr:TPA_asm: hypothetical protein HUJ06_023996 [Nelumbo nucifera]
MSLLLPNVFPSLLNKFVTMFFMERNEEIQLRS